MNRSVWFPGDLAERVQAEAVRQDRSFNWLVVRALESALNGQGSGDTSSVSSPQGSGSAKETAPTEPSASSRASGLELKGLANFAEQAERDLKRSIDHRKVALERQAKLNKPREGKG